MKTFLKTNKLISILFCCSIVICILYVLTIDIEEWFRHAGDWFNLVVQLAVGFVINFIFYVTQIYLPSRELGIKSEYIFCHEDGDWIKKDAYLTFLRRLCQSKGFSVTNNHALRMSLNSNVLLPMGISVADRAAMLGHSIQTNLQYYSFAQKDYLDNVRQLLDSMGECPEGTPREPLKIVPFTQKEKPQSAYSSAL